MIERIYLDVETYRPNKDRDLVEEDIVLIGMLHEGENKPIFFENFRRKEDSRRKREREILTSFYKYLKDLRNESKVGIEIVGFNILRFDVPLLIAKSLKHGVVKEVFGEEAKRANEAELLSRFWHKIYIVDLLQVLLPFNRMAFKKLRLVNAVKAFKNWGCKVSLEDVWSGEEIANFFEQGKRKEIKDKNEKDLKATRELYKCLKEIFERLIEEHKIPAITDDHLALHSL